MPYRISIAFLFCITLLSVAQAAHAHVTGASFTATTSPYVVDIGYDPTTFAAGEYARFDFVLRDEKTGTPLTTYDQIWVRITHGGDTLLATGISRQPFGPTTLLYVFNDPGTYALEPSFRDADGNEIAAASFPIIVSGGRGQGSVALKYAAYLGVFAVGLAIGVGINALIRRRRA